MEAYKHSCPYCGQHVEYTAEYCGRQMKCPICGNVNTFPAIPPKTGIQRPALRLNRPSAKKFVWTPRAVFLMLRDFPHWKTAGQIATPFVIIVGLLVGAGYVKKHFTESPEAAGAAPGEASVQADPNAWRKMTDLTRADQAVQDQLKVVLSWQAVVKQKEEIRAAAHRKYPGDTYPPAVRIAEEAAAAAKNNYSMAYQRFNALVAEYQRLGGTVDYQFRLSNN